MRGTGRGHNRSKDQDSGKATIIPQKWLVWLPRRKERSSARARGPQDVRQEESHARTHGHPLVSWRQYNQTGRQARRQAGRHARRQALSCLSPTGDGSLSLFTSLSLGFACKMRLFMDFPEVKMESWCCLSWLSTGSGDRGMQSRWAWNQDRLGSRRQAGLELKALN